MMIAINIHTTICIIGYYITKTMLEIYDCIKLFIIFVSKQCMIKRCNNINNKKTKIMKKLFLMMFAVMLTVSFTMTAQERQGRRNFNNDNRQRQEVRMDAKDRAEWMAKELNLTDAQKEQVKALFEEQDAKRTADVSKMREQRNQEITDRDKAREEMRAMREQEMKENQENLEKIIGKENMEKLDNIRKERMSKNRQGRRK